jgi:hypothetical protein
MSLANTLAISQAARSLGKTESRDTIQLQDLTISPDQSSKWQQLAEIPKPEFERLLRDPKRMPSTAGRCRGGLPPSQYNCNFLRLQCASP